LNFNRLRLNGFKSFVDPTDLQILPGLTGIVGPNGCGKSNLLDALRWVMGENRPTSMRGDGMDDVIFGGTDLRPARAFAEVVLEVGDLDSVTMPVQAIDETVEIVRKINLESGSVYRIEGKEVLAREVRMLFADSSTGSNSPSLVRQGQIASLINEHPKSRRKILEEAAGIAGIYQRRHESELRLNASENNLSRVNDILSKLREQLKVLAKQASQAGEYRSLGVAIRKEEALLLYSQWKNKKQEVEAAEQEIGEIVKARSIKQQISLTLSRERETKEELLPSIREKQATDQIGFRQLQSMKDSFDEKHRLAVLRIDEMKKRISDLDSEYLRETELSADAESVLQKLIKESKELEEEKLTLEERIISARSDSDNSETEFKKREIEYDNQAKDFASLLAEKNTAEKSREECKQNLLVIEGKISQVKGDQARVDLRRKEIEKERKKASESLTETEVLVIKSANSLEKLEEDCQKAMSAEVEGSEKLIESKSKLAAIISEIEALQELAEDRHSVSEPLLNEVSAKIGYELALGAAMSDEMNFPRQTTGEESGWMAFQKTFHGEDLPENIKNLSHFVEHPKELSRRLKSIGIVDSKDGARLQLKLSDGQTLVSKEGDLWRWDGFVRKSADISSETVLKLKNVNRLKKLHQIKEDMEKLVIVEQDKYQLLEEKFKEIMDLRDGKKYDYINLEKKLTSLKLSLSKLDAEYEINGAQLEGFNDKADQLQKEFEEFSSFMSINEIDEESNQDLLAKENSLNAQKHELENFRAKNLEDRLKLEDILSKDQHGQARLGQILDDIKEWESRQKRSLDQQANILTRKDKFQVLLDAAVLEPENIEKEVEALAERIVQAERKCADSTNTLIEAEKNLRQAFLVERESQKLTEDLKEKYVRAEVSLETMKQSMEEMETSLTDNTGLSVNEFEVKFKKENFKNLSIISIQEKLEKLKRRREIIGPVNLRAEEDEKEINDEFEALNAQRDDLEAAIRKLRSAISDLNKEGRGKLMSAFDQVNQNFKELFKTLFGGGSSNLMFVESQDPLEAGLEIMCQPPGKKLSSLSLLSGGEQTLAAISLIFAVFLARPSPICVLDEVDAPLDDANVVRFCRLLDEMNSKTKTRFLIITHNPITMARMNRLFGVTMGEKGVSQLVSVDLDRAEELVEA
tara:strand:- start:884 stop:4342 length:3459 start_codon:yes stop_codon:yes gene_type:complete